MRSHAGFWTKFPLVLNDGVFREALYRERRELLVKGAAFCPDAPLYLLSYMHDSAVLGIEFTEKSVTIRLSDNNLCELYFGLCQALHLDYQHPTLPVTFVFSGVTKFQFGYLNKNNKLIPLQRERYLPAVTEYLYDEVIRLDAERITIGMMLWARRAKSRRWYQAIEIEAKRLEIQADYEPVFQGKFGEKGMNVLRDFLRLRAAGQYLCDRRLKDFIAAAKL